MISVIIPVLNEELSLKKTLAHLKTYKGEIEFIIVDGGSSDKTVQVGKHYGKVIPSKRGRGLQMNKGAFEAKGDTLLFLHADTIPPKNGFPLIHDALQDNSVGGAFKVTFDRGGWLMKLIEFRSNFRASAFKIFFGDQAIFVRKDVFIRMNGFKNLPIMEDLEFSSRMKKQGKVALIKEPVLTSARKFLHKGMVKTYLSMGVLMIMFHLRCSFTTIKKAHDRLLA